MVGASAASSSSQLASTDDGVDDAGFALGLPTVTTTEKTIMGGYAPIVQVGTGEGTAWQVVAYECGQLRQPDRVVQRIAAIRPAGTSALPARLTP